MPSKIIEDTFFASAQETIKLLMAFFTELEQQQQQQKFNLYQNTKDPK